MIYGKKKPRYQLKTVKAMITAGQFDITATAELGGIGLGFSADDIRDTVLALTPLDFYKSMPSDRNPKEWQDVYLPNVRDIKLYVKIKITDLLVIISFKEM